MFNNGIIIQYGYASGGSLSNGQYTNFPVAFPGGYKVIISTTSTGVSWIGNPPCLLIPTSNSTAFHWAVYNGGAGVVAWIAISS